MHVEETVCFARLPSRAYHPGMKSILYLVPVVGLLSFGAVVGCGDDSDNGGGGTGATGGAAGAPACEVTDFTCGVTPIQPGTDACVGQETPYCADTYGDTGNQDITDITTACAKGPCLSESDPQANIDCVNNCVQDVLAGEAGASPVTSECTACAAAVANCAKDNCISHCLVDTGCCEPCREACGCEAMLDKCTGLTGCPD